VTDIKTFHDTGVDAALADALASRGITHPFPIQELTLPMALKGADIIGQARTGTGKTLAFGLPLLQRVDPARTRTQALVVVPTRELCLQVASDLEIGDRLGVTSVAVYGGVPIEPQTEALRGGVHVVVGTPGRLLDHLNRGNLDLSHVTELVLDEADEMLDMGFLPDVERLIEATPAEGRHTMLFSATMPSTIVSLARRYMSHPTFMRAEMEESDVAPTVEQHFFLVHRMDKPRVLARILQTPDRGGVYVFTRTKNMADRLVLELDELGVSAIAIHGDLRQTTREKNLDRFRDGRADVLVATEVAARGLDVEGVTHVVNYDCPDDEKMYLHRIGRTARAGAAGVAITFAQFNEVDRLNVIRKAVEATDREVEEVFSTSDRLAELFGLPAETPWEHLGRRSGRSARSGGRSRSGGGEGATATASGGDDRRSERRTGRSDGRSKNQRRTEGRSERSSSRRRDAAPSGGATPEDDEAGKATAKAAPPAASGRSRARASAERGGEGARTRTRTRARTTGAPERDAPATSPAGGEPTPGGRSRSRGETAGGRKATSDAGAKTAASGGRSGDEAAAPRGGRSRDEAAAPRGRRGRGGEPATTGRNGGGAERHAGEVPTRRGPDARGEGSPQPSRRVKVEHLP
jgi:superfamily II DNA/RNA helicase